VFCSDDGFGLLKRQHFSESKFKEVFLFKKFVKNKKNNYFSKTIKTGTNEKYFNRTKRAITA